ncbi:MAG: Crp/Fnr family transcriptional regulator [Comamonadaceae bacterium]|nr:Crp/Fnr family transcriptional regulator [Comamonadaceae bacterium]
MAPIETATLVRLGDASRMICCRPGRFALASPRRPEPSWWLIRSGNASLGRIAADGAFVERRRIGPAEWFDVTGALDLPGGWAEAAIVHEPLELLALPLEALFEACDADEAFARAFTQTLAGRMDELALHRPDVPPTDALSAADRSLLRSHARLPGDPAAHAAR